MSATPLPISLRLIPLDDNGRDRNGNYWGIGLPLYRYSGPGVAGDLRAKTRGQAKAALLTKYPNASFSR